MKHIGALVNDAAGALLDFKPAAMIPACPLPALMMISLPVERGSATGSGLGFALSHGTGASDS